MSRLSELRVVENETRPFRIRKLHGSWCLQKLNEIVLKNPNSGEHTPFQLWEFISAHTVHAGAVKAMDRILHPHKGHEETDQHHVEACS